jgi:hypothetical protein
MLKCNTLIIKQDVNSSGLSIGDGELLLNDGSLSIKDNTGQIKKIENILRQLSIEVDDISQTITTKNKPYDIIITDYITDLSDSLFEQGSDINSIRFKEDGLFLLVYNINIELLNNKKTNTKSYFRIKNGNNFDIIQKTTSYGFHNSKTYGHDTLISTYISTFEKNDEIKLSVEKIKGNGYLRTIPNSITIDILKLK